MIKLKARVLLIGVAAAMALLALPSTPALAHHKEDHEQGNNQTSKENFQAADEEASDQQASDTSSEDSTSQRSSTSSSRESSPSSTPREPDPDPEPSQAPPSTKGPGGCDDYSGSQGGPYDHDNCDGSQGMHGGGGNGKCAGCTGKADDKGPGGQHPGDHNNGYECDHNNGVGKGNPAHSRCPRPVPPPPSTTACPPGTDLAGQPPGPNGCDVSPNELCPSGTDLAGQPPGPNGCDDVLVRTDEVCPEGTDFAGQDIADVENCVLGTRFHNDGPTPPLGAILPRTGSGDILSLIAIGLLLIGSGLMSLRLRKKA